MASAMNSSTSSPVSVSRPASPRRGGSRCRASCTGRMARSDRRPQPRSAELSNCFALKRLYAVSSP
jgi:hypothetical protein